MFKRVESEYLRVASTIENFVAGTDAKWDWEYFLSKPLQDPYLLDVQGRCYELSMRYPVGSLANGFEDGIDAFLLLAQEVRTKASAWPSLGASKNQESRSA